MGAGDDTAVAPLAVSPVPAGLAPAGYFEAQYAGRSWRFYGRLLAQVVEHSAPGPILDLGAGTGLFTEAAHRWGLDCIGIEGSEEGVREAHARVPELDMRQGLLSDPLPFEDGTFATIVLNQVIEHLDATTGKHVAHEALRCLRPGGVFLVTSPCRFNKAEALADPTHVHLYIPTELRTMLVEQGFANVVSCDSPLPVFGRGHLGMRLARLLMALTRSDRLSATANCRALKAG